MCIGIGFSCTLISLSFLPLGLLFPSHLSLKCQRDTVSESQPPCLILLALQNGSRWTVAAESKTSVTLVPRISGNPCFTRSIWMKFMICHSFESDQLSMLPLPYSFIIFRCFLEEKKKKCFTCVSMSSVRLLCSGTVISSSLLFPSSIYFYTYLFFIQFFLYFNHLSLYLFSNFIPSKVLYHQDSYLLLFTLFIYLFIYFNQSLFSHKVILFTLSYK